MKLLNRKLEFPSTYVIIFAVTLIAAAATWFVPGGEYVTGDDGVTFVPQESVPQTWQIMTSLYEGFTAQAGIIVFLLIIGGAFWIVNSAKAVDAGIHSFLAFTSRLERFRVLRAIGVNNIVLVLIMLMFSIFGAVFGMSEETIAFTVLIVPLAISMGYDSIVGVCMVYVAAHVGFAGAVLNPFTVGVAQNLSGLPMFSGFEYRLVCWAVLNLAMIIFVLHYAHRIHRDPKRSVMYEADAKWREKTADASSKPEVLRTRSSWVAFAISSAAAVLFSVFYAGDCEISIGNGSYRAAWLLPAASFCYIVLAFFALRRNVRYFILTMLLFTVLFLIIGALGYSWYIEEIAALFLALGILSGIAAGYNANRIAREFLEGAKDIFSAALVVGLAAGIIHILENGRVIDTILYSMASGLGEGSKIGSSRRGQQDRLALSHVRHPDRHQPLHALGHCQSRPDHAHHGPLLGPDRTLPPGHRPRLPVRRRFHQHDYPCLRRPHRRPRHRRHTLRQVGQVGLEIHPGAHCPGLPPAAADRADAAQRLPIILKKLFPHDITRESSCGINGNQFFVYLFHAEGGQFYLYGHLHHQR